MLPRPVSMAAVLQRAQINTFARSYRDAAAWFRTYNLFVLYHRTVPTRRTSALLRAVRRLKRCAGWCAIAALIIRFCAACLR